MLRPSQNPTITPLHEISGLVEIGDPYTPPTFVEPAGRVLDLDDLADLARDLIAGDIVAVTVFEGSKIFNLEASDFTVDATANTITLAGSVDIAGRTFKITIAAEAVHEDGDQKFFFGTELLEIGQPVVDSTGELVLDETSEIALHTAESIGKNLSQSFSFFDNDSNPNDNQVTFTLDQTPLAGIFTVKLSGTELTAAEFTVSGNTVEVRPLDTPVVEGSQIIVTYRIDLRFHKRGEPVFDFINTEVFQFVDNTSDSIVNAQAVLAVTPVAGTRLVVTIDGVELGDSEFSLSGDTVTVTPDAAPAAGAEITIIYRIDINDLTGDERGDTSFIEATFSGGEDRLRLGNEAKLFFGGEQAFYTAADAVQELLEFHRVRIDGLGDGEATEFDLTGFADAEGVLPADLGAPVALPAAWFDLFSDENITLDGGATVEAIILDDETVIEWLVDDGTKQFAVTLVEGDITLPTADHIEVRRLDAKGMPGEVLFRGIDSVTIDTGAGTDLFTIIQTDAEAGDDVEVVLNTAAGDDRIAVNAAALDVTINSGGGDDIISIGSEAGLIETDTVARTFEFLNVGGDVNAIEAVVTVNGGGHGDGDVLNIDETGDSTNNTGTLTATQLTGLGIGGSVTYGGFEILNINLGDAAAGNDFLIESTHGPAAVTNLDSGAGDDEVAIETIDGPTNIFTREGDDDVLVGSGAGLANPIPTSTLDDIQALLTIDAGAGADDTLSVFDSGDTSANSGRLTATELTGLGMFLGILYAEFELLALNLSNGNDDFFIETTHATLVDIHLGDETAASGVTNDVITIETIAGITTIEGGTGNDLFRVNYDDQGNQTFVNGIGAELSLHGQDDSDTYEIGLSGDGPAVINVLDQSNGDAGVDDLFIFGTFEADFFVLQADVVARTGMIGAGRGRRRPQSGHRRRRRAG